MKYWSWSHIPNLPIPELGKQRQEATWGSVNNIMEETSSKFSERLTAASKNKVEGDGGGI